jgi:hypothetical protein
MIRQVRDGVLPGGLAPERRRDAIAIPQKIALRMRGTRCCTASTAGDLLHRKGMGRRLSVSSVGFDGSG